MALGNSLLWLLRIYIATFRAFTFLYEFFLFAYAVPLLAWHCCLNFRSTFTRPPVSTSALPISNNFCFVVRVHKSTFLRVFLLYWIFQVLVKWFEKLWCIAFHTGRYNFLVSCNIPRHFVPIRFPSICLIMEFYCRFIQCYTLLSKLFYQILHSNFRSHIIFTTNAALCISYRRRYCVETKFKFLFKQ